MTEKYEIIKTKLKEEFFGIDEQIDTILNSFETWETVRDYQVRPQILNIWGLTGTGKSELIHRIVSLLEMSDDLTYLKFNNKTTNVVDELRHNELINPIFVFDEIQYLKTKNEESKEIISDDKNGFNIIWDLLDSGVVNIQNKSQKYTHDFKHIVKIIDIFIENNVSYKRGLFIHENLSDICRSLPVYPRVRLTTMFDFKHYYFEDLEDLNDKTPNIFYDENEGILKK